MKRSKFSLSHYRLLTCDMGELVPIGLVEVLPGDTFRHASSALIRVSPLLAPVMHPVHVRIHHWFVPNRIIWDEWESFITGGPDGNDNSNPPYIEAAVTEGGLGDYLGLPPNTYTGDGYSALPFRAYGKIWNEWYRDQDLQSALTVSTSGGVDTTTNTALQKVAWEKDRYTTARPWTQKGPDVVLPIGDSAPVVSTGATVKMAIGASSGDLEQYTDTANSTFGMHAAGVAGTGGMKFSTVTGLEADLSSATPVSINDLREAFALQRYEEARARYGSRYTEYLRYLGVRSSDARLQRPEYLGGGKQTIQFSEVLQTGPDTTDEGVANLKGHGIGALRSNRYQRFFEEHGWVVSLMSVVPKTIYANGIPKHFYRANKEDFWQRELQHIGQAEIFNREVFGEDAAAPGGVFGYQDRYDEYRRMESGIAADFRSTLDFWHMARMFASEPALNASFVQCDATKRINAVSSEDVLWCMVNHNLKARRLVSGVGSSFIK